MTGDHHGTCLHRHHIVWLTTIVAFGAVTSSLAVYNSSVSDGATARQAPASLPGHSTRATKPVPTAVVRTLERTSNRAPAYRVHLEFPQVLHGGSGTKNINAALRAWTQRSASGFIRQLAPPPSNLRLGPSTLSSTVTTDELSNALVGFTEASYWFPAGAAHGTAYVTTTTFNARTGVRYRLSDLFAARSKYLDALARDSRALLPRVLGKQTTILSMLNPGTAPKAANFTGWSITPFGLKLTFGDYQVAPYAAGTPTIVIPYSSLTTMLRADGPVSLTGRGPVRTTLLPASSTPDDPECYASLRLSNSAVPRPLFCANGKLNVAAWNTYASAGLQVLGAGERAFRATIVRAMCSDLRRFARSEAPYEIDAERLAIAYYGWLVPVMAASSLLADCRHGP